MSEKICMKCKEVKLLTEFKPEKRARKGRCSRCRECVNRQERERRMDNPEKARQRARRGYIKKCRFKASLRDVRKSAKRSGYMACSATPEETEAAFNGHCAICGVPESECFQRLHLDHCHVTGTFRGWLCYNCNNMLGRAKDSEDILNSALHYLANSREYSVE